MHFNAYTEFRALGIFLRRVEEVSLQKERNSVSRSPCFLTAQTRWSFWQVPVGEVIFSSDRQNWKIHDQSSNDLALPPWCSTSMVVIGEQPETPFCVTICNHAPRANQIDPKIWNVMQPLHSQNLYQLELESCDLWLITFRSISVEVRSSSDSAVSAGGAHSFPVHRLNVCIHSFPPSDNCTTGFLRRASHSCRVIHEIEFWHFSLLCSQSQQQSLGLHDLQTGIASSVRGHSAYKRGVTPFSVLAFAVLKARPAGPCRNEATATQTLTKRTNSVSHNMHSLKLPVRRQMSSSACTGTRVPEPCKERRPQENMSCSSGVVFLPMCRNYSPLAPTINLFWGSHQSAVMQIVIKRSCLLTRRTVSTTVSSFDSSFDFASVSHQPCHLAVHCQNSLFSPLISFHIPDSLSSCPSLTPSLSISAECPTRLLSCQSAPSGAVHLSQSRIFFMLLRPSHNNDFLYCNFVCQALPYELLACGAFTWSPQVSVHSALLRAYCFVVHV